MTTYTFTRGRTNHEHGSAGANNTPALRDYDVQVQTALTSIGTNRTTDAANIATLQGYGLTVFAKGITAEDNSTGVTAGTTETGFTNYVTIPTSTLAVGDRISIRALTLTSAQNSTDTLALKLVLASTTDLKTTALVVAASAAADAGTNDIYAFDAHLRVVAIGAAGTAKLNGYGNSILTGGATWQNATSINDVTTIATNAAIYCGLTYTWSVSNAGNVVRIKDFFLTVTRPSA